ncbi:MAG: TrmH family RNA methyltransferase [Acidimicrobiales bacterium]
MDTVPLSPRNRGVRRLRDLSRNAEARREHGLFLVEGWKLVALAFDSSALVREFYLSENVAEDPSALRLVETAIARNIPVGVLSAPALERISGTISPQPVFVLASRPETSESVLDKATFTIVCADVRDPGNMGSIVRIAMASGADVVVAASGCADPYSPKAVRASAGGIFGMPVLEGMTAEQSVEYFHHYGTAVIAAAATGGVPYMEHSFEDPFALVVGNEGNGLPVSIARHMDASVTVPLANGVESLNVASACAVLCFEAVRQRGVRSSGS